MRLAPSRYVRRCAAFVLGVACVTACSPKPPPPPTECFIGDPNRPTEVRIVHRAIDGGVEITSANAEVPLATPPQGGKILFVGVAARNIDGCTTDLTASLRDPCTNKAIALERRPILLEVSADGWGLPRQPVELDNYSNLPACPRAAIERNVQGEPYTLEVSVKDADGRTASTSLAIVPSCSVSTQREECLCECDQRYNLGASCSGFIPTDAGRPAGECKDAG